VPRWLIVAAAVAASAQLAPIGCQPVTPIPGLVEYQQPVMVPVPVGAVNVAGGNLVMPRTELALETRLGTWAVSATYNSSTATWLWNYEMSYDGTTFVDPSGAVHTVTGLAPGAAIPGTYWVVVDANTIKTKGGLAYEFVAGKLTNLHWTSSTFPRIEMVYTTVAGASRVTRIRQCFDNSTCHRMFDLDYDAVTGKLTRLEDRTGREALFTWTGTQLTQARDGLDVANGWPGFRYDYVNNQLVTVRTSEEERVEIAYDSANRVLRVSPIGGENPLYRFTYTGHQDGIFQTTYKNPINHETVFHYDAERRIRNVKNNGTGEEAFFEWEASSFRPSKLTDTSGLETTWTFVGDDVATRTDATGNVLRFTYQPNAVDRDSPLTRPVLEMRDDVGLRLKKTYDSSGRLTRTENGLGEGQSYEYAGNEMIDKITLPNGVAVRQEAFGEIGLPERVIVAGKTSEYRYDGVGNPTKGVLLSSDSAPGRGGVVSRTYDADRNMATTTLADLDTGTATGTTRTLTIAYRSDGRRKSITRPAGGDTQFVYDTLGRLIERREYAQGTGHGDWQSFEFEYDAAGRQTAFERPNGMREEWTYDAQARVLTKRVEQDGVLEAQATYAYEDGRLLSVLESVRGSTPETYGYDEFGRVERISYPDGERIEIGFDERSRPNIQTYYDGSTALATLIFTYDLADRETGMYWGFTPLVQQTFANGRLEKVRYGNGLERTFTYNPNKGNLTDSVTMDGTTTVETTHIDPGENWALLPVNVDVVTRTFGALAVRTAESYSLGTWAPTGEPLNAPGPRAAVYAIDGTLIESYDYDWLNNLTRIDPDGPSVHNLVYNSQKNRLLRINNGSGTALHTYAYDEAGFTTNRDGVAYGWTGAGRIKTVAGAGSFVWDTRDQLVSFTIGSTTRKLLFGGAVTADAAGNPTHIERGSVRIRLGTNERLYRHRDLRGNVKFTTDQDGNVVAHYHYEPYGVRATHGSAGDFQQDLSFAGGSRLGGIYMLGARLYDGEAGRFLSPDPVYQVVNQYSYANGNPLWFSDPNGMDALAANAFEEGWGHMVEAARINYIAGELRGITGELVKFFDQIPIVGDAAAFVVDSVMDAELARIEAIAVERQKLGEFYISQSDILARTSSGDESSGPASGPSGGGTGGGTGASSGGSSRATSPNSQEAGRAKGCVGVCIGPARWHRPNRPKKQNDVDDDGGGGGFDGGAPPPIPRCVISPVELVRTPQLGWLMAVLLPAQLALAFAVVRRARRGRDGDGEDAPGDDER
jgi:RHS repeat-associated protein